MELRRKSDDLLCISKAFKDLSKSYFRVLNKQKMSLEFNEEDNFSKFIDLSLKPCPANATVKTNIVNQKQSNFNSFD